MIFIDQNDDDDEDRDGDGDEGRDMAATLAEARSLDEEKQERYEVSVSI